MGTGSKNKNLRGLIAALTVSLMAGLSLAANEDASSQWKSYTQKVLTRLVTAVEYYKVHHRQYPAQLEDLFSEGIKKDEIRDLITTPGYPQDAALYVYQVQPGGRTYSLFSRGPDALPATADDIYPDMNKLKGYRLGYLQVSNAEAEKSKWVATNESVIVWRTPAQGLQESAATKKPILYDFCAEWCGPCKHMLAEVFENSLFAESVNRSFVPVRVVDRKREEGANPQQIKDLQERYHIDAFPTLVVQFQGSADYRMIVGYGGAEETMDKLDWALADR